jgi:hypothetical protein
MNGCPHRGARHGQFSVLSTACDPCGRRWQVTGCLSIGPRANVEILRDDPRFLHTCTSLVGPIG